MADLSVVSVPLLAARQLYLVQRLELKQGGASKGADAASASLQARHRVRGNLCQRREAGGSLHDSSRSQVPVCSVLERKGMHMPLEPLRGDGRSNSSQIDRSTAIEARSAVEISIAGCRQASAASRGIACHRGKLLSWHRRALYSTRVVERQLRNDPDPRGLHCGGSSGKSSPDCRCLASS